jgi:hypothetical protein
MEIKYKPENEVEVKLYFDSPHVVIFDCWYRHPGEPAWTKFGSGKDQPDPTVSMHTYLLNAMPLNSELTFELIFAGNPQTAYKARVILCQQKEDLNPFSTVSGVTNENGVDKATVTLKLI